MENIVIILCSLSFFALSLILLKKRQSRIILSIDNIVIVFFIAVSSILFPLDYFYSKYSNTNGKMLDIISKFESIEIILYYFAVVLFLIPFVFCFRWVEKKKMVSEGIVFEGEIKHSNTFIIGLFLLIIGFTADFLFLQSYGGYSSFLNYSNRIRAGVHDIANSWTFLDPIRGCISISSFLMFASIRKKDNLCFIKILLFVFSLFYAFIYNYSRSGRLALVLFLAFFPVYFFYSKYKPKYISIKILFLLGISVIIFSWLIVRIGISFSRSAETNIVYTVANESAFPFSNFKLIIQNISFDDYRLFGDLVAYPLFLLPSSIWRNIYSYTASDICTILTSGGVKGTNGIYGEMPCDLISLGYLQFGFVGVVIVGAVFGCVLSLLFLRIKKIKVLDFKLPILVYLVIFLVLHSVYYCDPYLVVKKMIPMIVLFFVTSILKLFKTRSYNPINNTDKVITSR